MPVQQVMPLNVANSSFMQTLKPFFSLDVGLIRSSLSTGQGIEVSINPLGIIEIDMSIYAADVRIESFGVEIYEI